MYKYAFDGMIHSIMEYSVSWYRPVPCRIIDPTIQGSLDRHCRMKRIDMAIKLDHELRLTRRRSPDMQNFEADLFMMVSRPSEAN